MAIYVVCGLGFGDEGKGQTTAWLTKQFNASTVIRYNGGPQAAHNVVSKGKRHLFCQFGAGMAVSQTVQTFLSQQMAISPPNLLKEASVHEQNGLLNPLQRIKIDGHCPVVTPWHKILNRARELSRGDRRFGSTGMGVGATFIYARSHPDQTITAEDLVSSQVLLDKVESLLDYTQQQLYSLGNMPKVARYLAEQSSWLVPQRMINALTQMGQRLAPCILTADASETYLERCLLSGNVLLEGAQGTLLDFEVGTVPHVTQSTTRCCAAAKLLQPYVHQVAVTYIGISRPYAHRHGAGPLPTENPALEPYLRDRHNLENVWQGGMRVGWFDCVLADYARQINPELDYLVITNLDRLSACESIFIGDRYNESCHPNESFSDFLFRATPIYQSIELKEVQERVESAYKLPLLAISAGEENAWTTILKPSIL